MAVEELGEILELVKSGAGDAEGKYQFVDVREEEELGKAKLDGELGECRGPSYITPAPICSLFFAEACTKGAHGQALVCAG